MFANEGKGHADVICLVSEICRSVLADLARRKIPGLVPDSETTPALVIFRKGEFSRARIYFGRLSPASNLELIFVARAVNVIRMELDTDQIRMMVPAPASNLVSMFCAIWLTFRRAQVGGQAWSLHDITGRYPDVTSRPFSSTPIRVFGRLVLGQEDLQVPDGIDVRLPARAVS